MRGYIPPLSYSQWTPPAKQKRASTLIAKLRSIVIATRALVASMMMDWRFDIIEVTVYSRVLDGDSEMGSGMEVRVSTYIPLPSSC